MLKYEEKLKQGFFENYQKSKEKLKQVFFENYQNSKKILLPIKKTLSGWGATFFEWGRYIKALPRTSPFLYKVASALRTLYYRLKHGFYAK